MKKNGSFFKKLCDANYAFAYQNSRGMRNLPIQGKGPSEHE